MTGIHVGVKVSGRGVEGGRIVAAPTWVSSNVRTEGVGHVGGGEVWVGRVGMGPDLVEEGDLTGGCVDVGTVWGGTGEGLSPERRMEGNPTGHRMVR